MARPFKSDLNEVSERGYTPLQQSIIDNDLDRLRKLIKKGADINFRGDLLFPPLHYALSKDRQHMALLLMHEGADINLQDASGKTPLHIAVEQAQETLVLTLLKLQANPNIADNHGKTALHYLSTAKPEIINMLAQHGADLNAADALGQTPLHVFVEREKIVECLLRHGADPNIKNLSGFSPFMMMLEDEHFNKYGKSLQEMLNYRADMGSTNKLGENLLLLAARLDSRDAFARALETAELAQTDQNGNNVLHALARTQNVFMIGRVLSRAPELLHNKNTYDRTPLAELVRRADRIAFHMDDKFMATARMMIAAGADPNVVDDSGRTLLHHAIMQNRFEFAEMLLQRKINPDIKDNTGKAALHYAIDTKNIDLVDLLLDHNADPDLTDERGWTVLDRLAEKGDRDSPAVQRLIVGYGQYNKQLPLRPDQILQKPVKRNDQPLPGSQDKKDGSGFKFGR